MGTKHLTIWIISIISLFALAACGGSGTLLDAPADVGDPVVVAVSDTTAEGWGSIPGIPLDTPEDAVDTRGVSSVPAGLGSDYILMNGGYVEGTDLVLENYPDYVPDDDTDPPLALSYAMYKASGLEGLRPLSLNIECLPGGLGEGYFVGVANYTTGKWQWFGPVSFPEFELDLSGHSQQFVTNIGNMYFLLVVPPGNSARHSQYTVVTGPADPGVQPGYPHHLVASDGQFPEQVRLSWLGGTGAAEYQVFRRAAWGADREWHAIGTSGVTSYLDAPLPDYKMFYYRVRSVNAAGESRWSNVDTGFAGGGDDPCVIHGEITSMNAEPLSGIHIGLVGLDDLMVRVTNEQGKFYFGDLPPGEYIVAPRHPDLTFFPEYRHIDLTTERRADIHFNAAPTEVFNRVGGFTFTFNEAADGEGPRFVPLAGVTVISHPAGDPAAVITTTSNEHGFWLLEGLPDGINLVQPALAGLNFIPNLAEVIVNGHNPPDRHDFLGVPAVEPPPAE